MTKATRSAIDTAVKDKAVNPVSTSLLDRLDIEWNPEAPDVPSSEGLVDLYNWALEKVDPNGVGAMRSAVMMYGERDL